MYIDVLCENRIGSISISIKSAIFNFMLENVNSALIVPVSHCKPFQYIWNLSVYAYIVILWHYLLVMRLKFWRKININNVCVTFSVFIAF